MPDPQQPDYDALAKAHGGVDYDAIAAQVEGGTPQVEVAGVDLTPTGQRISGFQERLGSAVAAPYSVGKAAYDTSEQHRTDAEAAAKRGDYARAALHLIGATPQSAVAENLIVKPSKDQYHKMRAAYDKGDYQGALLHGLAMFPVAGPLLASITEDATSGDPKRQGAAVADVVSLVAPEALRLAPAGVRVPGMAGLNPAERSAMDWATRQKVPMDAATATQNAAVQGVQFLADRSLAGSRIARKDQLARETALEQQAGGIAGRVHPTAVSPLQAGEAIEKGLRSEIGTQRGIAQEAYGRLAQMETNNPAMVVNVADLKRQLQPIRDAMYREISDTNRNASNGFHAMEQLLAGPDVLPLSVADHARSLLNRIAYDTDKDVRSFGQVIAGKTARLVDDQIQKTVQRAGPDAVSALKDARAAWAQKIEATEALQSYFGADMQGEPVNAFTHATWAKDAGVRRLRELAAADPSALPMLGRAYLDDLAAKATADGGFKNVRSIWTKWKQLGPETKNLLFKDPQVVKDMDDLLLFAKRAEENPNPSKTAQQLLIAGELGQIVFNPTVGIPAQAAGAVVAKLLRTPAGIKALRDGFVLPLNHPGTRKAIQVIQAARIESQSTNGQ